VIFIPTGGLFGENVFPDFVKGGDNLLLLFGQLEIHWLIILLIEGLSNFFTRCAIFVGDRVPGLKGSRVPAFVSPQFYPRLAYPFYFGNAQRSKQCLYNFCRIRSSLQFLSPSLESLDP
jgi:hypothetical protein